jgi:hypothetical protein
MNDPLRQFKQQPWLPLFQVAGVTIAIAALVELLLIGGLDNPLVGRTLGILFSGIFGVLLPIFVAAALGGLAVYLCQTWRRQQIYLNTGSLWALVLCLMLAVGVKSLLLSVLIPLSYNSLIGIILGVFWQGRSAWRY